MCFAVSHCAPLFASIASIVFFFCGFDISYTRGKGPVNMHTVVDLSGHLKKGQQEYRTVISEWSNSMHSEMTSREPSVQVGIHSARQVAGAQVGWVSKQVYHGGTAGS